MARHGLPFKRKCDTQLADVGGMFFVVGGSLFSRTYCHPEVMLSGHDYQAFLSNRLCLNFPLTPLHLAATTTQDDSSSDDLMFTCAVTGWSEFDPEETQTCEGTSQNGLSHEIQFKVDYSPPNSETRAENPSFDLGEMLVRTFGFVSFASLHPLLP